MKDAIEFIIPAVPVAQPRTKASAFGDNVKVYSPTTIKKADGSSKPHPIVAYKATARLAAEQAYRGPPLDGPLICVVQFVLPRPKAKIWKNKMMPRYPHTSKPDIDNLLKSTFDALTGLLWIDDTQIAQVVASKYVASGDEQPHTLIAIEHMAELGQQAYREENETRKDG